MTPSPTSPTPGQAFWPLVLVAAAILMITMGARQSMRLFIAPMQQDTGMSFVAISFALAVVQFLWGASQPVFGALADRGAGLGRLDARSRHGNDPLHEQ
ncbi:MAG: hypothetical protein ACK4F7_04270 [Inhella sp.]